MFLTDGLGFGLRKMGENLVSLQKTKVFIVSKIDKAKQELGNDGNKVVVFRRIGKGSAMTRMKVVVVSEGWART